MPDYLLTWVTQNLAVGYAPMSYEELDSIREQGIDAIVNLCGEFSDLHEIEEKAGFEVYFLPIPDENAPKMEEMEDGLAWLDEAIYLGKKVLVHCHHGIGRTGTFVTAYLLRRGFGLKKAGKLLKSTRANPTNFSQWWLLRKFGKKEGELKLSEPTPENRESADLEDFYRRYEALLEKIDSLVNDEQGRDPQLCCSGEKELRCEKSFSLDLIEALYLHNKMNITLPAAQRQAVIARTAGIREETHRDDDSSTSSSPPRDALSQSCPLREGNSCLLHKFRPVHCRLAQHTLKPAVAEEINKEIATLSASIFEALFGIETKKELPLVDSLDGISGKFIQRYFHYLMQSKKETNTVETSGEGDNK